MSDDSTPLAYGGTAHVHALPDDASGRRRVVKRYHDRFAASAAAHELARAKAVFDAGVLSPEPLGLVDFDGGDGLAFARIDGPTLLSAMLAGAIPMPDAIGMLASLQVALHQTPLPQSVHDALPTRRDALRHQLENADLPPLLRLAMQDRLNALPDGDALLHGDFHPANILLSPDGPVTIDWVDAAIGHPDADVARTFLLIAHSALPPDVPPEVVDGRGALASGYVATYTHISKRTPDIESWLPVLAAARLSENAEHGEDRERLLRLAAA